MDLRLDGRVALVTGGTRNIGAGTAAALSRAGASVAVLGRADKRQLDETLKRLRETGPAFGALVDLADPQAVMSVVDEIEDDLGPVDILVNNAGVRPRAALTDISVEAWDGVIAVNMRAPFLFAQRVVPGMMDRRWGRIINVSGLDALAGSHDRVHVTSSKGGLFGLTAALAPACALRGITVNTVVPGAIDTHRHTPEWYPDLDAFYRASEKRIAMGRLGTIEEVADTILFLVSDMASYTTGQTITVAGGFPLVRRPEMEEVAASEG
jgi:3-oxoacyl-[acyl-carrier protein] reductase